MGTAGVIEQRNSAVIHAEQATGIRAGPQPSFFVRQQAVDLRVGQVLAVSDRAPMGGAEEPAPRVPDQTAPPGVCATQRTGERGRMPEGSTI